ncbi:hypothetical protein SUNI508_06581 [Seiridium unicorne]|uniref:Uncharacterized protein n=1 Tax=Seiridium unicorne TaxID=138068 RepID=A0ABR2V0F8_9PEZI
MGKQSSHVVLRQVPDLPQESISSSFDMSRATNVSVRSAATTKSTFRPLRKALGNYGSFVIMGGTVTTLGVMGFLVFLWTGEGPDEGQSALSSWRFIILEQWITQAITLTSLVLQITSAAQASVCTGLVAAMVLERHVISNHNFDGNTTLTFRRHGVPLSRLAEYSLIRSINDGPLRLSWLLLSSWRRSLALQTFLATFLLLGSIAVQFTSTILVSDLSPRAIVGNARNDSRGVSASLDALNQFHLVNQYCLSPTFVPFGEVPGLDASPSATGISDTGIVRRINPLVPQANRTNLRQYEGRSFVFNSRVVCVHPSIDDISLETRPLDNPSFDLWFLPYLSGSISYDQTFKDAGMDFPLSCSETSCFPAAFNCSVGVRVGIEDRLSVMGCVPDGRNAPIPGFNSTITSDPIANTSEVFLFIQSNINFNTTFGNATFHSPRNTSTNEEWTSYKYDNGVALEVSLCFQQLHYDRAHVRLSRDHDVADPTVQWNANASTWDTSQVRKLFGTSNKTSAGDSQWESFEVQEISNSTRSSTTHYLTDVMITDSYNSFDSPNVSILLSPYGGGSADIVPHVAYQALFADVLSETNRPAIAFQNLITSLSGSIINSILSQLDIMEEITSLSSTSLQAPRRLLGLVIVLVISVINLATVTLIVSLYLVRTEHTSAGNYWHAIAQVASDITQPILHRSTQATDDEVKHMLGDYDIEVKLERRDFNGGVKVVRCQDGAR